MQIYLIRHTHASEALSGRDEHRYLTATGRRVARAVGHKLAVDKSVSLDAVFTSPLVRAVQTAELVADAVGYTGEVTAMPGLMPGSHPRATAQAIAALGGAVAVVGHEPTIGALGAYLAGSPGFPPFRKGQVCLIERGQPMWTLLPDVLEFERLLIG